MEELEKDPRIAQKIKRFRNKQAQMKHIFTEVKQNLLTHLTGAFIAVLNVRFKFQFTLKFYTDSLFKSNCVFFYMHCLHLDRSIARSDCQKSSATRGIRCPRACISFVPEVLPFILMKLLTLHKDLAMIALFIFGEQLEANKMLDNGHLFS